MDLLSLVFFLISCAAWANEGQVYTAAIKLDPNYEVLANVEIVWQKPGALPKALLLVAHGCSHSATDFWPQSETCPNCAGLPQELNITQSALNRGWAVLAISSADRNRKCWRSSPPQASNPSEDILNVRHMLEAWLAREIRDTKFDRSGRLRAFEASNIESSSNGSSKVVYPDVASSFSRSTARETLASTATSSAGSAAFPKTLVPRIPVFGLGASSGGAFVLLLAMGGNIQFAGLCSEVMALPQMLLSSYIHMQKAKHSSPAFPPTMFVHMPKDTQTAGRVHMNMELLKSHGVPVKQILIPPKPLTPDYLHTACRPEVSLEQSRAIFGALSSSGYLTAEGMLRRDPRQTAWRKVLQDAKVPGVQAMRLAADASPIAEELNLLWARHEIVSTTMTDMMDWFEIGFLG